MNWSAREELTDDAYLKQDGLCVVSECGNRLANIIRRGSPWSDAQCVIADWQTASLMAAAPELLAACKELLAYEVGHRGGLSQAVRLAKEAVRKATDGCSVAIG
jgi:hypothetical protein